LDPKTIVIVLDASVKNNIASSISYIHFFNNLLKKTLHHAVNVIPTEAELFAIRYSINQVVQIQNVSCIIVVKIVDGGLYFIFPFYLYFTFLFFFYF